MFYKYRRKNIMTKCIQAYIASSVKQTFTNCFSPLFTGSLRCVWVRLVYIILDTTTNFTVAFTARHTRYT